MRRGAFPDRSAGAGGLARGAVLREDTGFCREAIMSWCEAHRPNTCWGWPRTAVSPRSLPVSWQRPGGLCLTTYKTAKGNRERTCAPNVPVRKGRTSQGESRCSRRTTEPPKGNTDRARSACSSHRSNACQIIQDAPAKATGEVIGLDELPRAPLQVLERRSPSFSTHLEECRVF